MMNTKTRFLVIEKTSLKAPSYHMAKNGNTFDTLAGAKRSCTAINKRIAANNKRDLYITVLHAKNYAAKNLKGARADAFVTQTKKEFVGDDRVYVVMDSEEFAKADEMVETYNMLNPHGGKVMIRKSQLGGCCDPATETYHSM